MSAKLEATKTPGIYKRGSRYVISYRANGKQCRESFRTLDEARRAKSARKTDIDRGEFEQRSRVTLHDYAREWVKRYQGRGRRGFRENTRTEYERLLDAYALKYFSPRVRLTEISPSQVAGFVSWLCEQTKAAPTKEDKDRRVPLSDSSVRNAMVPLRACMATAARRGADPDQPHPRSRPAASPDRRRR